MGPIGYWGCRGLQRAPERYRGLHRPWWRTAERTAGRSPWNSGVCKGVFSSTMSSSTNSPPQVSQALATTLHIAPVTHLFSAVMPSSPSSSSLIDLTRVLSSSPTRYDLSDPVTSPSSSFIGRRIRPPGQPLDATTRRETWWDRFPSCIMAHDIARERYWWWQHGYRLRELVTTGPEDSVVRTLWVCHLCS